MICVDNLSFCFEENGPSILNQINFEIKEGEFVALLGRNGSGKSTLARMLNGLLLPTEGSVLVSGMDTKDENSLWNIRQRVGLVFQNPDNQIVAAVVEDDVAFGPENLGILPVEIRRRVDEALKTVGMYSHRKKAPHLLSGGQKQRVAIAGILAMKPKCIVLDEPTAMLDPKGRKDVLRTIEKINRESGITVILVTHNMEEAAMASRAIVLDQGTVSYDGTTKDLFADSEFLRSSGLGVPDTVALTNGLRQKGIDVPPCGVSADACAEALYKLYVDLE